MRQTFLLQQVCDLKHETLGLLPAETGVGDGFTVDGVGTDLLASILKIAFDHKALDHPLDVGTVAAAVQYLLDNARLLKILLA